MHLTAIDPFTGKEIHSYPAHTTEEVESILQKSAGAFQYWKNVAFAERAQLMMNAAKLLSDRKEEYALLMTKEMGKPLKEGIAEAEKCAWACEYYAEHAEAFLKDDIIKTDARKSYVKYQPFGTVLAVMPWNFPFWQVLRFAAPALMAGNVAVLKHASNVPGCAMALEELFRDAGFPPHVFRTLMIGGKEVEAVIANPVVKAVTLTGSTGAGRSVAAAAGKYLKKTVLELGGSDAYLVLSDADIPKAAEICAKARMINNGQSCIAAKRFIVVKEQREAFTYAFLQQLKQWKAGDPKDINTNLGPMARHDLRDELHQQVLKSLDKGAELLMGGQIPEHKGAFYPVTVLSNVRKGQPAYDEELFGPVASIITANDESDAIRIANDSVFGLGSAVFTESQEAADRVVAQLEAGSCFVNAQVKSDPRLPFGGVKDSGYGRELSWFGIREFVNIKTVFIGG
jgi:succinate-semialdehyde dehydrogenase/glutarate-semialdehyde dehydrogenase